MRQSERRTRRVGSAKETHRASSVKEIRQTSSAKRENQAKRVVLKRTIFLMMVCGVGLFAILFWKLWDIAVVQHERFQQLATAQQTLDLSVSARRGNIRDRNGNVMAMSATVYDLILSPRDLMNDLAPAKKFTKEEIEHALAALDNDEAYGIVLRAKGIVAGEGCWYHFDYTPGEADVREGSAETTGKLCVIGSGIKEDKLEELFK